MRMRIIFYICIFLFCTTSVFADFFNNRNLLMGNRAALMGGAYTALSDDVSGAYYNPAGLAFIDGAVISVNANIYSYQNYSRQGAVQKDKLQNFTPIPSTFGICMNLGDITFGVSVFQVDKFKFSTISILDTGGSGKIEIDTNSYLIGPSFAYKISDSFSIGISCFYHYFNGEMTISNGSAASMNIQQNNITSGGIIPVIGLKWEMADIIHMGLQYSSETIHVAGDNTYSYYSSSGPAFGAGEVKGDARLPHTITYGIAYVEEGRFTIALDFIWYFGMNYSAPNEILHTDKNDWDHRERPHFNISLGGEYQVSESIALRLGFFTNTSGATSNDAAERINLYGGTVGIGYKSDKITTNLGVNVMYGSSPWQTSDNVNDTGRWERLSISLIIGATTQL